MGSKWLKSSRLFFDQVMQETRRVVWPTQRDVVFTSIIVFIIAAMFSIFLFFVDQVVVGSLRLVL
ncbi:MAG: preprotein translocase subunit SecE [Alphaproteobacteria bacterium]|nr:preprotein translocase subunit SecE [Alphaproteobacteria bacterium]